MHEVIEMKIHFVLSGSIYDCCLEITDPQRTQKHRIHVTEDAAYHTLNVDVAEGDLYVTVTPVPADMNSALEGIAEATWKDKLIKKSVGVLYTAVENTLLQVGCQYWLRNVQHDDVFELKQEGYIPDTLDHLGLLELFPVSYSFFDLTRRGSRFELLDAFGTNRRQILRAARLTTLLEAGLLLIITYPFQMYRVRHLTKNRRIFKSLHKFNAMTPEQREKFLKKQEKFVDRQIV